MLKSMCATLNKNAIVWMKYACDILSTIDMIANAAHYIIVVLFMKTNLNKFISNTYLFQSILFIYDTFVLQIEFILNVYNKLTNQLGIINVWKTT